MGQTLINTLRFSDRLKEARFTAPQAEALARALGDELTEQLPSKADFQALEAKFDGLKAKFDSLRATLNVVFVLIGLLVALGLIEPVSKLFGN